MNFPHHSRSLFVLAAAAASLMAGSLMAAERGGMRQALPPPTDSQNRVPVPTPPPGISGKAGPANPPPGDERAPGSTSITFKGTQYVVTSGHWYVRRGDELVAVTPPAGVLVSAVPEGHSIRWIGGVPYFHADGLYYVWRERSRRYEIVQIPASAESPRDARPDAGRTHAPSP